MTATGGTRRRLVLLAGQAFWLGLMLAWVSIPASTIFLEVYGSGLLPVTYMGSAAAGAASTVLMARSLRRRSLVALAGRLLAISVVTLFVGWVALVRFATEWVSFALLIVMPIAIPIGFVFVVGQAGMLLDVRTLKASYPRVIAGFASGFVVGGLASPPLIDAFGRTEHLLLAAAVVAVVLLGLVLHTRRSFAAELARPPETAEPGSDALKPPTLRSLLSNRFVALIMAFQALSAVESQWLDYLVYDRAAQRYTDGKDLATFVSRFAAISYGLDIAFLLLVAGFLLRKFGLRYGLSANPLAVFTFVAAIVTTSVLQGSATTVVFVLVVASRVTDMVLSDGTTRASVSTAYQAVRAPERLAAQANVEGLAVPLAIGFSGVVLMVLRATVGTDGLHLPVMTLVVLSIWTAVALAAFRGYRVNLLANLRHRMLAVGELSIESATDLAVIDQLLASADDRDVRLGLDTLRAAAHPTYVSQLVLLCDSRRPAVVVDALDRLVLADPGEARSSARRLIASADPRIQAAAFTVLGSTGEAADVAAIRAVVDTADASVRAIGGLAAGNLGDPESQQRIGVELESLTLSPDPADRVGAAEVLASPLAGTWLNRGALPRLLADDDPAVVRAALAALRFPDESALVGSVVAHLDDPATALTALHSLVASGPAVMDLADQVLRGARPARHDAHRLMVRAVRMVGGEAAVSVLHRHVGHRDRAVGHAVVSALAALVDESATDGQARIVAAEVVLAAREMLVDEVDHASRVLARVLSLQGLADTPGVVLLRNALRQDLELTRERLTVALSILHGSDGMSRVRSQLASSDAHARAIALEWLDVTLVGAERHSLVLFDPDLSPQACQHALARMFPHPVTEGREAIAALAAEDRTTASGEWLVACALLAAAELGDESIVDAVADTVAGGPGPQTIPAPGSGIIEETLDAIRVRQAA